LAYFPSATLGNFSWLWAEPSAYAAGTAPFGFFFSAGLNPPTGYSYMTATSFVGRALNFMNSAHTELFSVIASDAIHSPGSGVVALCDTDRRIPTDALFLFGYESIPMYYKGQVTFLGRMKESRIYERMDLLTGEVIDAVGSAVSSTTEMAFLSRVPGYVTAMSVSATSALLPNSAHQMPLRIRGNEFHYIIEANASQSWPNVRSLAVHFRPQRARGRP
jgi:hypothetical protein